MKPSRNVTIMGVLTAAVASTAAVVGVNTAAEPAVAETVSDAAPMAVQEAAANKLRQQVASTLKAGEFGTCHEFELGSIIAMPGTPREQIEKVEQSMYEWLAEQGGDGARFQPAGRWGGTGGRGVPVALTYSFPGDGIGISGGLNSLNATLTGIFGSEAAWKAIFAGEFARWAEVTGVTYTEVSDDNAPWNSSPGPFNGSNNRGDVRIVMGPIDGSGGTLAFNFFPNNGDMQMDEDENWGAGATDLFFRNVITHEHGHGMGLAHTCPDDDDSIGGFPILMKPFIDTSFEGPQFDDRLSMQYLYGDRTEPNSSGGSSVNLPAMGLTNNGLPIVLNELSIHSGSDFDLFRIENFGGTTVTAVVSPVGPTYDQGPQNGGGSSGCTGASVASFNASQQGDLVIEVLRNNFIPDLIVDSNGLGGNEIVNTHEMGPDEEIWYLRVSATGLSGSQAQMYNISVSTNGGGMMAAGPDLTGDGCVDSTDLAILLAAWGSPNADFNNDNMTDSTDLAILLAAWTGPGC